MDTTTLKRISRVYSAILVIISLIVIVLSLILFPICLIFSGLFPPSITYTALGGACAVLAVGALGYRASRNDSEKTLLILHLVGLVIIIVIQVYISSILISNHTGKIMDKSPINDPLTIVYYLFGGYVTIIHMFGKLWAILVIFLTIPQIIALYIAVRVLTEKTNILPMSVVFST